MAEYLKVVVNNLKRLEARGVLKNCTEDFGLNVVPSSFVEAQETANYFDEIIVASKSDWGSCFKKQIGRSTCGMVSSQAHAAMLSQKIGDHELKYMGEMSEEDLLPQVSQEVVDIIPNGMTLDQVCTLLGAKYNLCRNEPNSVPAFSEHMFMEALVSQISENGSLIVNYDMKSLDQPPFCGHFSVIVAVAKRSCGDEGQRRRYYVLLLDTWPESPISWIPLESLYRAMNTPDPDNDGKFRGFLTRKNYAKKMMSVSPSPFSKKL